MVDKGSGAHEEIDLRHAEEPQDEAHEEDGQLPDGLNQEKVDEKLQYLVISLEPLHTFITPFCHILTIIWAQM